MYFFQFMVTEVAEQAFRSLANRGARFLARKAQRAWGRRSGSGAAQGRVPRPPTTAGSAHRAAGAAGARTLIQTVRDAVRNVLFRAQGQWRPPGLLGPQPRYQAGAAVLVGVATAAAANDDGDRLEREAAGPEVFATGCATLAFTVMATRAFVDSAVLQQMVTGWFTPEPVFQVPVQAQPEVAPRHEQPPPEAAAREAAAPFPQLPADLSLESFTIIRRLGERTSRPGFFYGCQSAVFEAQLLEELGACPPVALKMIMNVYRVPTRDLEEHFSHEVQVLQRLPRHRNVMRQFGHFVARRVDFQALPSLVWDPQIVHNSMLCVVAERLPTSLASATRRLHQSRQHAPTPISEPLFFQVMRQLLSGVLHLHRHQVAHRDMKADNLMITTCSLEDPNMELRIVDFGEAMDFRADGQRDMQVPFNTRYVSRGGSTHYLPPEIMTAIHGPNVVLDYDKSDVFAAGVVAYHLLVSTELLPFGSAHHADFSLRTFAGLPEAYSEACRNFVWALLDPNPARRLSAEEAVAHAIRLSEGHE